MIDDVVKEYTERIIEYGAKSEKVRIALSRAIKAFENNRRNALGMFPQSIETAKEVRKIKEYSIEHMDELIKKACESIERNHGHCYYAKTKEEALEIFKELVGSGKLIVKSKSLTSEEIHLREFLEELGNEVYETDLGEFIVQLMGTRPTHILAPAINVPREDVAKLLSKFMKEQGIIEEDLDERNIEAMVAVVRKFLRDKFFKADIGINGANALAADTGTMFIIENEGNARLSIGAPPVQIAIVGVEKIVPTIEDAFKVTEVTWRYANYTVPAYVNLISGPSKTGDIEKVITFGAHGPKELHVILLDNGRTRMREEEYEEALYCLRCGTCLYECPIYAVTAGFFGQQYMGGIGAIWDAFTTVGLEKASPIAYTCVRCGKCKVMCPLNIDIPAMISKLRNDARKQGYVPKVVRDFAAGVEEFIKEQK